MTSSREALVDTHCHLDLDVFGPDREEVIERAIEAGIARMIVPAVDFDSIARVLTLADHYPQIFAAIGVHPNDIPQDQSIESVALYLREMIRHRKVVAIGEIGLDYFLERTSHDIQHRWLDMQLALAAEYGLPVIVHNRSATADTLAILKKWVSHGLPDGLQDRPGVLHSYSGDWNAAKEGLLLGFFLGFTGPVTYKKADALRLVAAEAPIDRILVETDSPFLAPTPNRGRRNEPAYVRLVAEKLAELRGLSTSALCSATTANAYRLFRLL